MNIILATGIYPPTIGGPATYVQALARELSARGVFVTVVTYGNPKDVPTGERWRVLRVAASGGPILRWVRYARMLKREGAGVDAVIAFSSVSAGVPLMLSYVRGPKKILRLGGDFFWERATDCGSMLTLHEWYERAGFWRCCMGWLLRHFDTIVFSTRFQEELYERIFSRLPQHRVIENAVPPRAQRSGSMQMLRIGMQGTFLRVLFLGRFVGFKNLPTLLAALLEVSSIKLSLVGEGPMEHALRAQARALGIEDRVKFFPPVHAAEKERIFAEHDVLMLPSLTELSPNTALEARAAGLPVLLTTETGLSSELSRGMMLAPLRTKEEIVAALHRIKADYAALAKATAEVLPGRTWRDVANDFLSLLS